MKCPDYALVRIPASELTKPFSSKVSLSGTLSRFKRQKHTTLIVEGPLDAIWHSLMTAMLWDDWQWGKTSILVTEIPFIFFISLHHKNSDSLGVFFLHYISSCLQIPSALICSWRFFGVFRAWQAKEQHHWNQCEQNENKTKTRKKSPLWTPPTHLELGGGSSCQ